MSLQLQYNIAFSVHIALLTPQGDLSATEMLGSARAQDATFSLFLSL